MIMAFVMKELNLHDRYNKIEPYHQIYVYTVYQDHVLDQDFQTLQYLPFSNVLVHHPDILTVGSFKERTAMLRHISVCFIRY